MRQLLGLCTLLCVIVWAQSQCVPQSLNYDVKLGNVGDISKVRVPLQPLLTQYSQLATIFKPGPLNVPDRTDCPHQWTGLVDWHNPTLWSSGSVPTAGSDVVIPNNTKVLISHCSWPAQGYGSITIPASSIVVVNDYDMDLTFRNMYVQGKFYMGSSTCRLLANINVHFTGGKVTTDEIAPYMGAKGIGVAASGTIEVHGKLFHPTWTRLAATANIGDDVLFLDDEVNWEPDQQIVITTTVYDDLEQFNTRVIHQNEVKTIIGVIGRKVFLNESLLYQHYAGEEYQAEVGLLSRRIKFFGHPDANNFGGHILVTGQGRFSGAQAYEMGQLNMMARYPFHFHMGGEKPTNFVQDCAILNSQFRCITIHATNSTKVTRNVAFNIAGSCFYIEDGVEEKNEVSHNLAAHVRPIGVPASGGVQEGQVFYNDAITLHPSDHSAACFYITNAFNSIVGNAASGGWTGFSFPNLFAVFGTSSKNYPTFVPSSRPNLRFEGNSAHSAGKQWSSGSCFYVGGMFSQNADGSVITYNSGRSQNRSPQFNGGNSWMHWKNIRAWLCNKGVNHWGDRVVIDTFETHDCSRGAVLFGDSVITHALFDADSGNVANQNEWQTDAFSYYDTSVRIVLDDIIFKNFNAPRSVAIRATTPSDIFKPEGICAINKVQFVNTPITNRVDPSLVDRGSTRYYNIIDFDGSFSGTGTKTLLGSSMTSPTVPSRWWDFCRQNHVVDPSWSMYACPLPSDGTKEIAYIYVVIPGLAEDTRYKGGSPCNADGSCPDEAYIGKVWLWGPGVTGEVSTILTKNPGTAGVTGVGGWFMDLGNNMKNLFQIRTITMPKYSSLMYSIAFPAGTTFSVWRGSNPTTGAFALASSYMDLFNSDGTKYFFDGQYFYIKLVSVLSSDTYFGFDGVKLTDQIGWNGYDISVQASCSNCVTNAPPPTISPVIFPVDSSKIITGDTAFPRATPPEFREAYQSFPGAPVPVDTTLPVGWGWTSVADFSSLPVNINEWTGGLACAGTPVPATQTCGTENTIIRQPCPQGSVIYQTHLTSQILKFRTSFRYGFLDAWWWYRAWVKVNGVEVYSKWYTDSQGNGVPLCGSGGNDYFESVTVPEINFLGSVVTIEFGADAPGTLNDRSFAVSNFKFEVFTRTNSLPIVDCAWNTWNAWNPSVCPNDCLVTQTRSRTVGTSASNAGLPCAGPATFTQNCTCHPVDCVWNDWGAWSDCTNCKRSRTRTVNTPNINGGAVCPGDSSAIDFCPNCGYCGNGILEGSEQCDDGNFVSRDGCNASCATEYGWTCATPGAPCTKSSSSSNYIDKVTTSLPAVVPVTGTISLNIAYAAKDLCYINVAIFSPSWAYYGEASYAVLPGIGIARLTIPVKDLPATVFYSVKYQTFADWKANTGVLIDQFSVNNIASSSSIYTTHAAAPSADFTPSQTATGYSLSSFPTMINTNSPTEITLAYTAQTDSTITVVVQEHAPNWTWYMQKIAAVPAGTGFAKISIFSSNPIGVGAYLSLSIGSDANARAGLGAQFSQWTPNPVTFSSSSALQATDSSYSNTDSTSGFPVWFFVGGILIGMAVVVVGIVAWKVFQRKHYYEESY